MPLTKAFKDTVRARAQTDAAFRVALLEEGLDAFVNNDLETGKLLLRDIINATVGFKALAAQLHMHPESLMRMLSIEGNPSVENLFAVVSQLKALDGVSLSVRACADKP
jgi:DNA-binding phage protein